MKRPPLNILTGKAETDPADVVRDFYSNGPLDGWTEERCRMFVETVGRLSIKDIVVLLSDGFRAFDVPVGDVPQFSSLPDCFIVPKCLVESGSDAVSWEDLGYLISGKDKKEAAHRKYGENHGKMAEMFGLCTMRRSQKPYLFSVTPLGRMFAALTEEEQDVLKPRLVLRSRLMQNYYVQGRPQEIIDAAVGLCAESTRVRRHSSTMNFINAIEAAYEL